MHLHNFICVNKIIENFRVEFQFYREAWKVRLSRDPLYDHVIGCDNLSLMISS